jgi:hypothetical protein
MRGRGSAPAFRKEQESSGECGGKIGGVNQRQFIRAASRKAMWTDPIPNRREAMSPQESNNNSGGNFGRAAFDTADCCDAARAENLRDLVRSLALLAFMGFAMIILVHHAPELWPNLFAY